MDTTKLLSFLGHSSIYPPFYDFLLESGIKKRPKKNEGSESLTDKTTGLTLEFDLATIFDEASLIPKKSEGWYILSSVTFPRDFSDALPYGLSLNLTKADLDKKLGTAIKERPHIPLVTYFHNNMLITINWNKEDPEDAFIRFTAPNVSHKKNLGISVQV